MIRLLCLGDAHLGRYPTRIPHDQSTLSVRAVWNHAIEYAISEDLDAVILTGDMADNSNSYFEAYGALRLGLRKLSDASIAVVTIAGNHDYAVFPQLVESISDENLKFLGRDGKWSETMLQTKSGRTLRCVGWSFPSSHYDRSPLESLHLSHSDNFTVGILHGDLDGQSKYARFTRGDLAAQLVDLWLLGHVHAPQLYDSARAPVLYPGSLQPLDPGEPGVHGPWLVTIDDQNHIELRQISLASVRYEEIPIDVTQCTHIEDINIAVTDQIDQFAHRLIDQQPHLKHLSCRLILSGQTELHRLLSTDGLTNTEMFDTDVRHCRVTIDRVLIKTSPTRDLHEIAQLNNDPPGMLARWLLELEHSHEHKLYSTAHDVVATIYKSAGFKSLGEKAPEPDMLFSLVREQALLLLDELLAQKENNG